MNKHNSLLTKIRLALVKILDPYPDPGEAWCMNCSFNKNKTIVLTIDSYQNHLEIHSKTNPKEIVSIRGMRN